MDAVEARTFEKRSVAHEQILAEVARQRGCFCVAYVDWFTYGRWSAQGFQVQKGEKSTRLKGFAPITKKKEDGTEEVVGKRPHTSCLFCRCQVKPKENGRAK